ncbi:hypothetical protein ACUXQ2_005709 [Cupriavidus metallidurans]
MLSPHEFATLMLVKDAPAHVELDPGDVDALLKRQLVTLEKRASGRPCPCITSNGHSILKAVERIH